MFYIEYFQTSSKQRMKLISNNILVYLDNYIYYSVKIVIDKSRKLQSNDITDKSYFMSVRKKT